MLIKTHYDNLNVANNAPSDVIRAAYKLIIQKCESDLSPNADASRFLTAINTSFAVLSNPVQRAEYDQWLVEQEAANAEKIKLNTKTKSKHETNARDDSAANKPIVSKSVDINKSFSASEISTNSDEKQSKFLRWLIYTGIVLAILLAFKWFGIFAGETESKIEQPVQNIDSTAQPSVSKQSALTQNTQATQAIENTQNTAILVADSIPDHDQISIGAFIGVWKGRNGAPAGQQTLGISLKSKNSIVFNLDAKVGQSIGGVYGIAEFTNSYASFFSKDYNCSILFTIKSGVLQLNTNNCQAYHESGITFDGQYSKSIVVKTDLKPKLLQTKPTTKNVTSETNQTVALESVPVVATNAPKLLRFVATVKDATGNISKIELIAKDKEAARAIIRDFRGNPEIVKIKEVRK